jgi:hypothetical protein
MQPSATRAAELIGVERLLRTVASAFSNIHSHPSCKPMICAHQRMLQVLEERDMLSILYSRALGGQPWAVASCPGTSAPAEPLGISGWLRPLPVRSQQPLLQTCLRSAGAIDSATPQHLLLRAFAEGDIFLNVNVPASGLPSTGPAFEATRCGVIWHRYELEAYLHCCCRVRCCQSQHGHIGICPPRAYPNRLPQAGTEVAAYIAQHSMCGHKWAA